MKIDFHAMTKSEKAFTLVELLIVIAIIGILTVAFLPNVLSAPAKARDATRLQAVNQIVAGVEIYSVENGSAPTNVTTTGFENCFETTNSGLTKIALPKDKSATIQHCNTLGYYYYRHQTSVATGSPYYIVAARLENTSSANGTTTYALLDTATTRVEAEAIIGGTGAGTSFPYYIQVGPK